MLIEKIPLDVRIECLGSGFCAHSEYTAALINRFAGQSLNEHFRGMDNELAQLMRLMDISDGDMQYKQLANKIYGLMDKFPPDSIHEAISLLAAPIIGRINGREESEAQETPKQRRQIDRISLDARLKDKAPATDNLKMCGMDIKSFLELVDEMVLPRGLRFTHVYMKYFSKYAECNVAQMLAESTRMPEEERWKIQYRLLIQPFAWLDESPCRRYMP